MLTRKVKNRLLSIFVFIFFLIFLSSCSTTIFNHNDEIKTLSFNDNLTIEEFNLLLIDYAKNNPYPDLDK